MRLLHAIRMDMLLQWRQGFYAVYGGLTVLYILSMRFLPETIRIALFPIMLFSDPVMIGFYFIGGIVLLEKSQRVHSGLFTMPLRLQEYIIAKVVSLLVLALGSSLLIAVGTWGLAINWLPLLTGVILSSSLFTLFGLICVAYSRSLNHYLMLSAGVMALTSSPFLHHFGIVNSNLFYFLPTKASLVLLDSVVLSTHWGYLLYAVGFLVICMVVAWFWALRVLRNHIVYPVHADAGKHASAKV